MPFNFDNYAKRFEENPAIFFLSIFVCFWDCIKVRSSNYSIEVFARWSSIQQCIWTIQRTFYRYRCWWWGIESLFVHICLCPVYAYTTIYFILHKHSAKFRKDFILTKRLTNLCVFVKFYASYTYHLRKKIKFRI